MTGCGLVGACTLLSFMMTVLMSYLTLVVVVPAGDPQGEGCRDAAVGGGDGGFTAAAAGNY